MKKINEVIEVIFDKYRKMPVPVKASFWYTFCNILQKGISFIIIPVYTRMLTSSEYGQYSVFQSWRDILIILATLNLYCGVFTKAMVDYEKDRDKYTSCMQGLSTVLTCGLFMIYIVKYEFWNSIFEMGTITMILLFLYFVFYPAFSFWSVRQRVEYKYKSMVCITIIVSIATPLISIFLLVYTNLRANAVIWGYLVVQIAAGGIFYILQFVKGKVFFIKQYWVHGLKFNIPLIPHYLSLIVLGQADRIMIKKICGSDKTGIYNLAYQVSMLMNVFVTAINSSLVPWTYEKLKVHEYNNIKRVSNSICIIVASMSVGAILVAPEIIKILGTKEYLEAIWIIPAVAVSVYFTFCYGLFCNIEFYFGTTQYVMVASITGAILNVMLNAYFIPIYDFIAAGYTTLFCYFIFMVMHFIFMRRVCKKEMQGELVYDIRFIIGSCVLLCVMGFICMLLYKGTLIRYVVVIVACVWLVINKNKILQVVYCVKGKG